MLDANSRLKEKKPRHPQEEDSDTYLGTQLLCKGLPNPWMFCLRITFNHFVAQGHSASIVNGLGEGCLRSPATFDGRLAFSFDKARFVGALARRGLPKEMICSGPHATEQSWV